MNEIAKTSAVPQRMDTKEIAKATGKEHKQVLRDTRVMLVTLFGGAHVDSVIPIDKANQRGQYIWDNADTLFRAVFVDGAEPHHEQNQGFTVHWDNRGYLARVDLDRNLTLTLVSGYDIFLRNRVVTRLEELEKKAAEPKAIAYTTGRADALTATEQAELRAILHDGAERLPLAQRGAFLQKGWSKLKAHFKVPYREIPRREFTEALSIAARHVDDMPAPVALLAPKADQLTRALDSMHLMAESVADLASAVVHLSRASPPGPAKTKGLNGGNHQSLSEAAAAATAKAS